VFYKFRRSLHQALPHLYRLPNRFRIRHCLRVGWLILLLPVMPPIVQAQPEAGFSLRAGEGWLILLVYPASRPLVEDSPRDLLWSALNIELRRFFTLKKKVPFTEDSGRPGTLTAPYFSTIGHTIAWLHCQDRDGAGQEEWASLTGRDFAGRALRRLPRDGRGMGILFDTYPDAYVLGKEENLLRLFNYRGRREASPIAPRYLAFSIGTEDCASALALIGSFREAAQIRLESLDETESPPGLVFSSVMDPYTAWQQWQQGGSEPLGGGCATFGMALLKAAGQFHPVMDSLWNMVLDIPEDLIGEPGRKVGIGRVLSSPAGRSWERTPGQTRRFVNADPDRIWQWIGTVWNAPHQEDPIPGVMVEKGPLIELGYPPRSAEGRSSLKHTKVRLEGVVLKKRKE
jgi:hypothetical protein